MELDPSKAFDNEVTYFLESNQQIRFAYISDSSAKWWLAIGPHTSGELRPSRFSL